MNSFNQKANELLRNYLVLSLSLKLKRFPTEEELFEEFMCTMDDKIKTDLELRAEAFPSHQYKSPWPDRDEMIRAGYWPDNEKD